MKKMKVFKIIGILLALCILIYGFLFYWYSVRPQIVREEIREECIKKGLPLTGMSKAMDKCLREHGIEP